MLDDTNSEMLCQNAMDGFEGDVEHAARPRPGGAQGVARACQELLRPGLRALITKAKLPLFSRDLERR